MLEEYVVRQSKGKIKKCLKDGVSYQKFIISFTM
jgi:hypothetical protein